MVRKKLAVAVAAIGALQASLVSALGLGEFTLNSALNQPLDAEISLLDVRDLDESQLKIVLAGQQDFERAGVSRDYFLTNLKFNVELDNRGGGVIKVTTRDPVIEPYLNFLIEARWPTGRLLREYTVLLDLPVFSESDAAQVTTATSSTAGVQADTEMAEEVAPMPAPTAVPQTSARQTLSEGSLQAGEKYRVRQDDTLWEIAAKSRPTRSVSVQQTMVSIQRLNPEAFIRGNINRLKAGYVLRLPTEAEIRDVGSSEAIQEVATQNRAWRTDNYASSDSEGAQLDATYAESDSDEGYSEGARLSIATAGDSESGAAGEGGGAGSEALRSELDSSLENLDKAQRENEEMRGRLNDMESKIATLQRLLELKDDQLSDLQSQLSEQGETEALAGMEEAVEEAPAEAMPEPDLAQEPAEEEYVGAPAPDMDTMEEAETGEPAADMVAGEEPVAAAEEPQPEVVEEPQPVPTPAPTATDPLQEILSNPLYLGGAGAVVIALAVLLIMRRRKSAEVDEDDSFGLFEQPTEAVEITEDTGLEAAEMESALEEPVTEDIADQLAAEIEEEISGEAAAEEEKPAETVQSETGDAIAEADIYIAYGRYQQAIDLLTTAVSEEPNRSDIQVKLLEVYIETRDKPGFQQQYLALQALGDEDAVGQIKEMLSTHEGVADWLDDLAAPAPISDADMDAELMGETEGASEPDLSLDEDLDIDLDLDELGTTQENPAVAAEDADLDLDLDLDLDDSMETTQAMETVSLDETQDDLDLDLDLDSEELSLEVEEPQAAAEEMQLEEAPVEEEGFDLDLDDAGDLDLELGDIEDADLGELEAEFGESESTEAAAPETSDLDMDLDLAEDSGLELAEDSGLELAEESDLELGDLAESEEETLSMEAAPEEAEQESAMEFDLSEDLDLSLEEPVAEQAQPEEPIAEEPQPEPSATVESAVTSAADSDDFDFLADTDEVATKLDLARAYIDMGDTEGAKDILDEVLEEGSDEQKQEAQGLMERV